MPLSQKDIEKLPPMQRLSETKQDEPVTALIYGGAGCGKTGFAGTAGDRTLQLNIGNGIKTLKSPWFLETHGYDPIIVNISEKLETSGVPSSAEAFDMVGDTIDFALETIPDQFDTVVVDDATELRRFAMNKGLEINQKLGKSHSKERSSQYGVVMKSVQDYGIEMDLIEQFIAYYTVALKAKGKNFIMTAHQRLIYQKQLDKNGNPVMGAAPVLYKVLPGFTGQTFPDDVQKAFDWVFRMETVAGGRSGVIFRARTLPDEVISAKCRDGGVFSVVESNPHFLKMLQMVKDKQASTRRKTT